MSARITIQSGIAAGTSHRIAGRVARVGSAPQSDICLPTSDIPEHALTLEFRDDGCLVYNRCRDRIYIGAQIVEPDNVVEWPETDILQLGHDIELLLDWDDTETDEPYAHYEEDGEGDLVEGPFPESEAAAIKNPANGSKGAKTAMQLGVTILCLIGCVLLLIRDQNRNASPDVGPTFSEVITTSMANSEISRELVQRLQHAEAQRVRGRKKVARTEFQSIRDDLIAEHGQSDPNEPNANDSILRLIQNRLEHD